jgi:hypothetical protein
MVTKKTKDTETMMLVTFEIFATFVVKPAHASVRAITVIEVGK